MSKRNEQDCPICGKPAAEKVRPFCSKRCADIDLGKWLGGNYVLPGTEEADPEEMIEHLEQQTRH
ncbi:MAG: DNA gyrase inhibitor YacG [Minwuia sp.]|uniref:DNA gyrase inhibitor YacG n=1 Tax=Minwuia sp. TaxID=2493630 RepID=UPI003A83D66B